MVGRAYATNVLARISTSTCGNPITNSAASAPTAPDSAVSVVAPHGPMTPCAVKSKETTPGFHSTLNVRGHARRGRNRIIATRCGRQSKREET